MGLEGARQRMLCAAGPFGLSAEYSGTAGKGLTAIPKEHSCAKIRAGAFAHAQRHGVSSAGASAGACDCAPASVGSTNVDRAQVGSSRV